MKKKKVIDLLQDFEEDAEVHLNIRIYDVTGYYTVTIAIEEIDREGIHASIV